MNNPKNDHRRAYMRNYMREKRAGRWLRKQHQDKSRRPICLPEPRFDSLTAALMGDPPLGRRAIDQVRT